MNILADVLALNSHRLSELWKSSKDLTSGNYKLNVKNEFWDVVDIIM